MTPEQIVECGRQSKDLLESPPFRRAIEQLRMGCFGMMRQAVPGTKDALHWHYLLLASDELQRRLEEEIANGEHESRLIEDAKARSEQDAISQRIWVDPPVTT